MIQIILLFIVGFFVCPVLAVAEDNNVEPLTVAGMKLPTIFDDEIRGPYNRIYEELVKGYADPVKLVIQPYRRANQSFFKHLSDCLFIGANKKKPYIDNGVPENKLLFSDVVSDIRLKVYTRPDEPVITHVSQLKGETVAFDISAGVLDDIYREYLEENVKFLPSLSLEQALALLDQKRVKAAVAYDVDMAIREVRRGEAMLYKTDASLSLKYEQNVFVCWKDRRTEAFVSHINGNLLKLHQAGWIKRTLNTPG